MAFFTLAKVDKVQCGANILLSCMRRDAIRPWRSCTNRKPGTLKNMGGGLSTSRPFKTVCRPSLSSLRSPLTTASSGPEAEASPMIASTSGGSDAKDTETTIGASVWSRPKPSDNIQEHVPWSEELLFDSSASSRKIYCNRSLNMKSITAIGFDMDYTLAQYNSENFEALVYTGALSNLINKCGYPKELSEFTFDYCYMVRGLAIDKARGNILKMDRHKYVKIAYHGFTPLTREERLSTYGASKTRESFDEPGFALIDTLFSLPEAYLFAQMVEFMDANPDKIKDKSYAELYRDVRACVDMCHRDGTLKRTVANDPAKYIREDPTLVPMLEMLKQTGRKVFLVTNSLWDYTNVVMNFLCSNKVGKDTDTDWVKYFDVVIVGSGKPKFFTEETKMLFQVSLDSGLLANTDNGTPLVAVDSDEAQAPIPSLRHDPMSSLELDDDQPSTSGLPVNSRVFQGGSYSHLHRMLDVESGSEVLYAGDHIYGDILRSKKELGWRTMLVVPELNNELEAQNKQKSEEFKILRRRREQLEDYMHRLSWCIDNENDEMCPADVQECRDAVKVLEAEVDLVMSQHREALREYHNGFHKIWGQLMMCGYQSSRFGSQIKRFACLYTSEVSNLMYHSPGKNYRSSQDEMPHFDE